MFKKFLALLILVSLVVMATSVAVLADDEPVEAEPGQALRVLLLPKFLGIIVFDQAYQGALEAAAELENPEELILARRLRTASPGRSRSSPMP